MANPEDRNKYLTRTLLASGAVTATSAGEDAVRLPRAENGIVFVLDVSAAATEVDDTLNCFVQTKVDGTNWVDVVAFTEVLGNGGTKRYIGKIVASGAETMFENASALAAGAVRDFIGDEWRVRYVIVDPTGDNVSFTISVHAMVM